MSQSPTPPGGQRRVITIGTAMITVGIFWALIGIGNFCYTALRNPGAYRMIIHFNLMFQLLFFILPGLILAIVGIIARRRMRNPGE